VGAKQVYRRTRAAGPFIDQAVHLSLALVRAGATGTEQVIQPFRAGAALAGRRADSVWQMLVWRAGDEYVAVPDWAEEHSTWFGHLGGLYELVDRRRWVLRGVEV
jgi:hypothetical protein